MRLDQEYVDDRHPADWAPERRLWREVLGRAIYDLEITHPPTRRKAIEFLESADLLRVLDLAGIDRALAAPLRSLARR